MRKFPKCSSKLLGPLEEGTCINSHKHNTMFVRVYTGACVCLVMWVGEFAWLCEDFKGRADGHQLTQN